MTTIRVNFDGTHAFTWKGDQTAVRKLVSEFEERSAAKGIDPASFAEAAVTYFSTSFNKGDSQARRAHMIAVLYRLLQMDTGQADHPGRCIDYV